jgi:hypothetical protein
MEMAQATIVALSESVREIVTADGAILLDFEAGNCIALTPIALRIWQLGKTSFSCNQIAEQLAIEFHVPFQEVHHDTIEFFNRLSSCGFLRRAKTAQPSKLRFRLALLLRRMCLLFQSLPGGIGNRSCIHVVTALMGLMAIDMLHLSQDFEAMHALVRGWKKAPCTGHPDAIRRTCRAVAYACVWYPKRVLCLQRSAVMTCLLRGCGIPAEMVIGARVVPFKAHAWTEVEGRPINESSDVQKIYMTWERW